MKRLKTFFETYSRSTMYQYKWSLQLFFETFYPKGKLEDHVERYLKEKRDYEADLTSFFITLKDRPPKTIRASLSAVKMFLIANGIELKQSFWRGLRRKIKGSRALTMDRIPSNEELRKILSHMPIQGKALFLALATSGMRIGEALKLEIDDIELKRQPAKVNIRGEYTKTGNPRIAFISSEAKGFLGEWLKVREEYLKSASGKSHFYKKTTDDKRGFPFRDTTAREIWNSALKKTGLTKKDKRTKRRKLHPHVLRKFFRTRMGSVIPVDIVEALMGHEGYLTEVYRKYPIEELAKRYGEGEHTLTIFTDMAEIKRVKQEVAEHNKTLHSVVAENIQLKERISKLEEASKDLAEKVKKLLKASQLSE